MRYVMVWFTCSVEGCEARAEHLVALRQTTPNATLWIMSDDMPEQWGKDRLSNIKFEDLKDRQHTYCPEHAEPRYVERART